MSEMVLRLAYAICGATGRCFCKRDGVDPDRGQGEPCPDVKAQARAAIGAMREPTAAMKRAGGNADGDHGNAAVETWEIMIDAAYD